MVIFAPICCRNWIIFLSGCESFVSSPQLVIWLFCNAPAARKNDADEKSAGIVLVNGV